MYYPLIRPLLFALDPETAHDFTLKAMRLAGRVMPMAREPDVCRARVMGIDFPNRIGLAAGLDKDGAAIDGLARLGFGFLEIGTVTPRPQPGNPKPRIFRIPSANAIVNRMGFNNGGLDALLANVRTSRYTGVLGINIGKNFDTPIERAADDYLACLEKVYPLASYVTVNISSPNTQNLRQLQGAAELDDLLGRLKARQQELADGHSRYVPLTLKIAPDLDREQLGIIADALRRHRIDGVIATNTTITRDQVLGLPHANEQGGLSGSPVFDMSTAIVRQLSNLLAGEVPIIAAGGVMSGDDARAKLDAGAQLVQLYSGLIYRGPQLVGDCIRRTSDFADAATQGAF